MQDKKWIVFMYQGKELAAYTIKGTFVGELEATRELLAYEMKCSPEDIEIETR